MQDRAAQSCHSHGTVRILDDICVLNIGKYAVVHLLWPAAGVKHASSCMHQCVINSISAAAECSSDVCGFDVPGSELRVLGAGRDLQMAEMGADVEEGSRLLGKPAERMRRPSARSFLDYQDEEGSDSEASLGGTTFSAFLQFVGGTFKILEVAEPALHRSACHPRAGMWKGFRLQVIRMRRIMRKRHAKHTPLARLLTFSRCLQGRVLWGGCTQRKTSRLQLSC